MAVNRQRGLLRLSSDVPVVGPSTREIGVRMPSSGGAEAANTQAAAFGSAERDLAQLGETIGKYADHAAQVEGAREGKLAGLDPEFRPSRSLTIRGEAFDRAGLETYKSTVAIEVENDIQTGGDLRKKRDAWLARVPEEIRPDVTHQFRRAELVQARTAAREVAARATAEATGSLQTEIDTMIRSLHQRAFSLGLDATADATLSTDIGLIDKALRRVGPDGKPLVTPETARKLLDHARETVADARLLGAFDRASGLPAKLAFIDKFEADWKSSTGLASVYDLKGFQRISGQLRAAMAVDTGRERMRTAALSEDIGSVLKMAEKGYAPSSEQLAGLRARVEATGDPELTGRLALIEDVADFQTVARKSAPEEIEAYAARLRADMTSRGANPLAIARVEMAERLAGEARRELKTDALGWASRVGFAAVAPIDASTPEKLEASLKVRLAQAPVIAGHFRLDTAQYLRPEERRQLASLASQGGENLMTLTGTISRVAGPAATSIMAEIFPESPVVATLGGHVSAVGTTGVARDVADGIALMRAEVPKGGVPFKSIAPSADAARTLAVAAHGGSLNGLGRTEQALIAATNAAYEVRARRRGLTEVDGDLWKSTFHELIGARTIGGVEYGGLSVGRPGRFWGGTGTVIVPPNVRNDGFRKLVESVRVADFGDAPPRYGDGRPVDPADLRRAMLMPAGDGRYWLNLADADSPPRFLVDDRKEPFALDLKALEPVLRKRNPGLYIEGS